MKKTFVLVVLFILPIVAYLFFASGVNNFGKLPSLTKGVSDVSDFDTSITLKDKISIVGFLGDDVSNKKGNVFNLNQKIYKRFYEFKDFQFVMLVKQGSEAQVAQLKSELATLADTVKWKFVYLSESQTNIFFNSLKTDLVLDEHFATPYVFIIDKELNLRGRTNDDDEGTKYGFNTTSVAELNNKMEDDVKIILAEYRFALKKNSASRKK